MTPLPINTKIFLGQFRVEKDAFETLPLFIQRKPDQTAEERASRGDLPQSTIILKRSGVSGSNVPFVLKSANLTLCDAYAQRRAREKTEEKVGREWTLITFVFSEKQNISRQRQKELDASATGLKEFQRLLERRWADVVVFQIEGDPKSPAISMVFAGGVDAPQDPDLLIDEEAISWGLRVTRSKKKK